MMMTRSSDWVLKTILNRYPEQGEKALKAFLSDAENFRLNGLPEPNIEADREEEPILDRVHWSWLVPQLKSKTLREQKLFLQVLPLAAKQGLRNELKHTISSKDKSPKEDLREIGKKFLIEILTEGLMGTPITILPVYFLPPSPLSNLLNVQKNEIIRLIDFLALYDLITEIKQIVETKILKKIYSFLSKQEKQFLKQVALVPSYPFSRLLLNKWDGTEQSLRTLLHKKGISRLGAALSTQHPDFIWYVCHQLDIGRGTSLAKIAETAVPSHIGTALIRQVAELLREITL